MTDSVKMNCIHGTVLLGVNVNHQSGFSHWTDVTDVVTIHHSRESVGGTPSINHTRFNKKNQMPDIK